MSARDRASSPDRGGAALELACYLVAEARDGGACGCNPVVVGDLEILGDEHSQVATLLNRQVVEGRSVEPEILVEVACLDLRVFDSERHSGARRGDDDQLCGATVAGNLIDVLFIEDGDMEGTSRRCSWRIGETFDSKREWSACKVSIWKQVKDVDVLIELASDGSSSVQSVTYRGQLDSIRH